MITYVGKDNKNLLIKNNIYNLNIKTIDELFNNLIKVYCYETASINAKKVYNEVNNLTLGQCAITAMLVYDLFSLDIYKVKLDNGSYHYFNKNGDDIYDLTSDQFVVQNKTINYLDSIKEERINMNDEDLKVRYNRLVELLIGN